MKWCILKFVYEGETIFKLLRGFYGGYLDGDSWALNSGITKIECDYIQDEPAYIIDGYSGSQYMVHPDDEGMSMIMAGQLAYWQEQTKSVAEITVSSVKEYLDAQD